MYAKKIKDKWSEPTEYNSEINIRAHNITQPHFLKSMELITCFFAATKRIWKTTHLVCRNIK